MYKMGIAASFHSLIIIDYAMGAGGFHTHQAHSSQSPSKLTFTVATPVGVYILHTFKIYFELLLLNSRQVQLNRATKMNMCFN